MDRFIGLDAHLSSCTMAVVGPSGKRLKTDVVETCSVQIMMSVIAA